MGKDTKLSKGALRALDMLKDGTATVADLKAGGFKGINSAHLTALVNKGLVTAEQVVVEVPTVVKRKVNAYTVTDAGKEFKGE